MIKIKKKYQALIPESKVLNMRAASPIHTYSCDMINHITKDVIPMGTLFEYDGDTVPEGYEEVKGRPLFNYSTEEQVIGTWINGKPLYRITLSFDSNGGATNTQYYSLQDYGINDVDEIFLVQPSYYSYNGITYPFNYYDGNQFMAHVTKTTLNICLEYEPISSSPFVITLEYTKTTD